ncbi:hypothetical protein IPA_06235 [Ignicoccus pacificus DSM 13166]|uniref:Uncharacterized protein n=1 Tax=Ignicoccus pacificus DSM 13166 TaxID=940294 RepID=A0A977PK60_9CREN|nr:hypothetical protein IPA_06235 [Ignicoccus pacificus DSM 13166]
MRRRQVKVREVIGKKVVKDKEYKYVYYTLPLNIYVPKSVVEKFGKEYVLEMDEETGEIRIRPAKKEE